MATQICATVKAKFKCKVVYKEYKIREDRYSLVWECCDEDGDCCKDKDSCTNKFYTRVLEIEDFSVDFSPIVTSAQIALYKSEGRPLTLEAALRVRAESMFANESWDRVKEAAKDKAEKFFSRPPSDISNCPNPGFVLDDECTLESSTLTGQTTTTQPVNPPESYDYEEEFDVPNICVPPDR